MNTKILLLFLALIPTGVSADLMADIHKLRHQQCMKEQEVAIAFQALSDSLTSEDASEVLGEEEDLYGALDAYADWDDAHVDPLRGKTGWVIPDSQYISFKGYVHPLDVDSLDLEKHKQTSPYGWRRRRMHKGTDFRLKIGDSIRSAWDGRVRIRKNEGRRKGYGMYYVVRHPNGLETVYGHLSKHIVQAGDSVKAGQVLGLGGNTGRSSGPHLHLEFRFMGIALDPATLIDVNTGKPKQSLYLFVKKRALLAQDGLAGDGEAAYHRVRKGDTLGVIARKYHTSVERLCKLNGIRSNKTLSIGQRIRYK